MSLSRKSVIFMMIFYRLSTVGYLLDMDEIWFPLVYRTLIWHETQQNLSRRTRFVTKRHRSFAMPSPFYGLQAGSFHKMYQLFVIVNTLFSGSFAHIHFLNHFKTFVLLGETKKYKDYKTLLKQYCFELYFFRTKLFKGKSL